MASIAGSQFVATAANPVNVVLTTDGTNLPPPVPGEFNLEVWTGGSPPSSPASGYQGLLVDYNGQYADMIAGAFALTDTGTGGNYIQSDVNNQTIVGASGDIIVTHGTGDSVSATGNVVLSYGDSTTGSLGSGFNSFFDLSGNNDTITSGSGTNFVYLEGTDASVTGGSGSDTIIASSTSTGDTITAGSGPALIYSLGQDNTITGGSGSDTINAVANDDSVTGGSGSLTTQIVGNDDTLVGGSGPMSALVVGNDNTVDLGGGSDTVTAFGNANTIAGGSGSGTISVYGNTNAVNIGSGPDAITIDGANDSVNAGFGNATVDFIVGSTNGAFVDNAADTYNDTIVGFNNSAGDTIKLNGPDTASYAVAHQTPQNGGADTLVTLNDGSTILLKGVTNVSSGFFS
jgi:hypothetical protein